MTKYPIRKQIRVQRLQDKHRMVGQTFNPGGHTDESLKQREKEVIKETQNMTDAEIIELGDKYKAIEKWKEESKTYGSNSFEHNAFFRNFGWRYNELKKEEMKNGVIGHLNQFQFNF